MLFSERLYLLHLVKTLLSNDDHQYKAEYDSCITKIGLDVLAEKLKGNLEAVTRARAPTRESHGALVTGQQVGEEFWQRRTSSPFFVREDF